MNKKVIDNDRADVGRGAVVDPFVVFIYGALMPFVPYDFVSPFLPSIDTVLLQLLEIVLKLISIFLPAGWGGGFLLLSYTDSRVPTSGAVFRLCSEAEHLECVGILPFCDEFCEEMGFGIIHEKFGQALA
jgi:hypothetical protein